MSTSGQNGGGSWVTMKIPPSIDVITDDDITVQNQVQNGAGIGVDNTLPDDNPDTSPTIPNQPDMREAGANAAPIPAPQLVVAPPQAPQAGQIKIGNNVIAPGGNLWVNINAQFNSNTANINNANQLNGAVNNIANALLANPNNSIALFGSVYLPANANWNTMNTAAGMTFGQLADQRNQAIANMLIQRGVNPNQITMQRGVTNAMRVNGNFQNNAPAPAPDPTATP
jgi:hypothetical protein